MNLAATLSVTSPSDTEIVAARVLNAPRTLVFKCWTDPVLVPRWMTGPPGWTMPVCEIDLVVGGRWHFVWRKTDGSELDMHGVYREITPPSRLVATENWGGEWPETLNTVVLSERDGLTTASLTILYPSKAARDAAAKTGATSGMAMVFDNLEKLLAAIHQ